MTEEHPREERNEEATIVKASAEAEASKGVGDSPQATQIGRWPAKKRSLRLLAHLNKPFWAAVVSGLVVLSVSTFVQDRYWRSQLRLSAGQTLFKQRLDFAISTEDELTKAVGRLIAANALLVGAHEAGLEKKQYGEVIDQHNALQREWDLGKELLELHMKLYFSSPLIQKEWQNVEELLGNLDDELTDLLDFTPSKPSKEQTETIKECRAAINRTKAGLATLEELMSSHIDGLAGGVRGKP